MLRRLALVLALICGMSIAGHATDSPIYYGLSGSIIGPDNKPFNGTLAVQLTKPTAVNLCTSPVSLVTNKQAIYTVTNGAIVSGTSAKFLTNSCLAPAIPYYAQMFDVAHNQVYADNWFFPRMSVTNVDVGTLYDVGLGQQTGTNSTSTPIVVAIPGAIVASPAGQQTVVQPGSTSLVINNLAVTGTFSSTNTIAASISGNAATASSLQNTPNQCPGGFFATGIQATGNSNCSNTFPANSSYSTLTVVGGSGVYTSPGGFINYGLISTGETDFILNGIGGWDFFISTDLVTPVAKISKLGVITASLVGNVNGNVSGNATTASTLAGAPTQCPTNQFATGITSAGNANCGTTGSIIPRTCNTNGCYRESDDGTFDEWGNSVDIGGGTSVFIAFPISFPTACQSVVVSTVSSIDRITFLNATSGSVPCTRTGFTVGNNGTSASVSWRAIGF